MRLGLSSAAAADADVDTLLAASARRGLAALELRDEDMHGVSDATSAAAAAVLASDFGVAIAGLRITSAAPPASTNAAAVAARLDAPVLAAHGSTAERIAAVQAFEARGVRAMVEVSGPADGWLTDVARAGADVAWQIDDSVSDMAGDLRLIQSTVPGRLRYVRLLGGGPEAAMADGRGIGALMGQLALARFDGPLIVAPSSPRYHVAWGAWLGRRGGWGCGSKAERDVVTLSSTGMEE